MTVVDVTDPESASAAPSSAPDWRGRERRTGVVVCRGCCCGVTEKNPGADHEGHLVRLRRFARAHPAIALVRTTECLGPCADANVIVVRPSAAGRRNGGRPVWLGLVLDHAAVDLLETWVGAGGPGLAPLPACLDLHVISPPAHGRTR